MIDFTTIPSFLTIIIQDNLSFPVVYFLLSAEDGEKLRNGGWIKWNMNIHFLLFALGGRETCGSELFYYFLLFYWGEWKSAFIFSGFISTKEMEKVFNAFSSAIHRIGIPNCPPQDLFIPPSNFSSSKAFPLLSKFELISSSPFFRPKIDSWFENTNLSLINPTPLPRNFGIENDDERKNWETLHSNLLRIL